MLVLSRKQGESIVIGGNIVVQLVQVGKGRVRLGIEAPRDVSISRPEQTVTKAPGKPANETFSPVVTA